MSGWNLTDGQAKRLAYLREQYTKREDAPSRRDEIGMAELFASCYADRVRYCPEGRSWYAYEGGVWRKDCAALTVAEQIKEFSRLMLVCCARMADEDGRRDSLRLVARLSDRRMRDRLMKDAASVRPVRAAEFDANPNLLNCKRGTYDLERMIFRPHDWRDLLTLQARVDGPGDPFPRWDAFIAEITEGETDKADYLKRALGYSLLGTPREECMFILHGKSTRNGKSTLLSAVCHLLGDYATVSPVSIICGSDRPRNAEAASPTLAGLKGRRLVAMSESNQYGRLDEEAIKQLTGGEEISARNLYEAQMTFLPQFTLWLSCNDLPSVRDPSVFASDRVRVIEFNRHFGQNERDGSLKDTFRTPAAMQGIFSWLIDGFARYRRDGLIMSESMKAVIRQYEKDNDAVLQFLEERCVKVDEGGTKAKDLYDAFCAFARQSGAPSISAKKFYAALEQRPDWQDGRITRHGYPFYKGIALTIDE